MIIMYPRAWQIAIPASLMRVHHDAGAESVVKHVEQKSVSYYPNKGQSNDEIQIVNAGFLYIVRALWKKAILSDQHVANAVL